MEKDGIIFYKKVNEQDEKTRYLRMGNYSLDDIGDIFEKGFLDEKLFPEKDLFTVEKGITGRSLIIKANEDKIGKFGLNESLLKFFNLPGYNTNSANSKKRIILDKLK